MSSLTSESTQVLVSIQNCKANFPPELQISIDNFAINSEQHTVILGSNASGKSALGGLIAGFGEVTQGKYHSNTKSVSVSVVQQQALIDAEKQKDCADILDIIPEPTLAEEILYQEVALDLINPHLLEQLIQSLSLDTLLDKPFRALSTGETKKLMLANAILQQPPLLILDDPWDGIDIQASKGLAAIFTELSQSTTLVFVLNRLQEIPDYCQQLVFMDDGNIKFNMDTSSGLEQAVAHVTKWLHLKQGAIALPESECKLASLSAEEKAQPMIRLTNAAVKYGDNVVFQNLNWTVYPNQHWQIYGPNGSGKTCLLNLLTGDHPQCYVNDIYIFGFQRGNGESIWQIKKHIGMVSNGFHLDYQVNCSAADVILSGFYDSIGLYQPASNNQKQISAQWLSVLGLSKEAKTPFKQLSHGDQRLLLIARAMVKHPKLLILDEPCNGLDEINRLKVLSLIELIANQDDTSLLYVSHYQEDQIPSINNQLSMLSFQAQG